MELLHFDATGVERARSVLAAKGCPFGGAMDVASALFRTQGGADLLRAVTTCCQQVEWLESGMEPV